MNQNRRPITWWNRYQKIGSLADQIAAARRDYVAADVLVRSRGSGLSVDGHKATAGMGTLQNISRWRRNRTLARKRLVRACRDLIEILSRPLSEK